MNIRVDHRKLEMEFLGHLEDTLNSRILFSGPFGTGKSTFLEEILENQRSDNLDISEKLTT